MRSLSVLVCCWMFAAQWRPASGMDPEVLRLLPADPIVVVEVQQPLRLLETAVWRDLRDILRDSQGVRQALSSPEVGQLRQAARFLENSLGTDWQTGLSRLTAGGLVIAVHSAPPGAEPDVTAIVSSDDEATLRKFLASVEGELKRRADAQGNEPDGQRAAAPLASPYRAFDCYQVGQGHFAVLGRRLLAANRRRALESALDQLSDPSVTSKYQPPESLRREDSATSQPALLVTVNVQQILRQDPQALESLQLPANDPLAVLLLGGYLDLLRRAEHAAAALNVEEEGLRLSVRLPVGTEGANPGLSGFFASAETERADPLLLPAGTIAAASWYRDYAALWRARQELFHPPAVRQMEEDSARQRQQTGGVSVPDIFELLGPHFRFAAARSEEVVYKTPLPERLPAIGLAVDLRDEAAFRERIFVPLDRLLFAVIVSQGGTVKSAEHRGAKLQTVRFAERESHDGADGEPGERLLYNFSPTYAVTRGHFVVGSSAQIVRGLIDELEHASPKADGPGPSGAFVTDTQRWDFAALGDLLRTYQPRLVREAVLDQGLSVEEAEHELNIVDRVLRRLGGLHIEMSQGPRQFELNVRLGKQRDEHGP